MRKNMWLALALVMILPVMFLTVSCAKETVQAQSETTPPETPPITAGQAVQPRPQEERSSTAAQAAAAFSNQNVNFDFASAALSDQAREILNTKAEFLHANPGVNFTVEGHCDERGTSAYNIALGERRAEMVKQYFLYQGIRVDRMNTVSYGEERPLSEGQNEASWAINRRAQFVIH